VVTAKTFRKRTVVSRNRNFARAMRHQPTECEKKFWWMVRNRTLGGHKFKRQVLIGNYIADFMCVERLLIVELDGSQHAKRKSYDEKRDTFLKSQGYRVIRVWDSDFLENPDGVMEMVFRALETAPSP
jgi:very-short-patch-repair endonuclease